ncbi:MAG: acylphosphatase [Candidatus Aenigmatarchaeota archaeon]|nr:acylphosphatase [Candidatus Aenigmarchaeota archaeon]
MNSAVRIIVKGRVHGVFFRDNTRKQAMSLGITGYVQNLPKGVEIIAEGPKTALEQLIMWCSKGPALARVEGLEVRWRKPEGKYKSFEVKY